MSWTPGAGATPAGAVDGLIFTLTHYDMSTGAPSGQPGMICHEQDSAGSVFVAPSFFEAFGMGEGAYVINIIRYRTTQTTDQRSGANVYGTFIDAQGANLWLVNTAARCSQIPSLLCP